MTLRTILVNHNRVVFSDAEMERLHGFAEEVWHAKESQNSAKVGDDADPESRINHHLMGKLGEAAVYRVLKTDVEPDINVYLRGDPTIATEADLTLLNGAINLHVKTRSRGVDSWLVSKGDRISKIVYPNDFLCLCEFDGVNAVTVYFTIAVRRLTKGFRGIPMKKALRDTKWATYLHGGLGQAFPLTECPHVTHVDEFAKALGLR